MQSCSFIGHRNCPIETKNKLKETVKELIIEKNISKFYVGTQGDFDKIVYDILCEFEKEYNIELIVVLAYLNHTNNEYFDNKKTIFPDILTKTPIKYAIRKRNTFMIDNSDYLVTYMNSPFSNTYTNIEEAFKKKKTIINLGEFDIKRIGL